MFSIPYLGLCPQTTLQPTDKAGAPHLLTGLFLSKMRPLNQLLASFAPSLARSRVYKQTCPFPSLGCHRSPCRPLNRQIGLGLIDMRLIFLLHGVSTAGNSSQPCASGSMPAPLVICLSICPPICPCEGKAATLCPRIGVLHSRASELPLVPHQISKCPLHFSLPLDVRSQDAATTLLHSADSLGPALQPSECQFWPCPPPRPVPAPPPPVCHPLSPPAERRTCHSVILSSR